MSNLRSSLRTSVLEGMLSELPSACAGGGVLAAWALFLGLPPVLVGLLGALPFVAQSIQLPAAWLTRTFGSRRSALFAIGVSRQLMLPLALLPFAPLSPRARQAVFLSVAALATVVGVAGNNAWAAWMADLVPQPIRARYFGRRTAFCALGATACSLLAGLALDRGPPRLVLSGLALLASATGAMTTALLRRQRGPLRSLPPAAPAFSDAVAPLRDTRSRRLLAFQLAWSVASGLGAAFYPLFMIGVLHLTFLRVALYNAGLAVFRTLAAPFWRRAHERAGARRVLLVCSLALSVAPLLWTLPTGVRLWPLALDALVCGTFMAGYNLAALPLPLAWSSPGEQSFHVAAFAAAGGIAMGIGSLAGAAFVHALPAHLPFGLVPAHALIPCVTIGRLCAAALALRIVEPARAQLALRRAGLAGTKLAA